MYNLVCMVVRLGVFTYVRLGVFMDVRLVFMDDFNMLMKMRLG
jgi:hypothetical protein